MPGSDGTNMLTEMTASALSRMTVARCGAVRAAGGMRTPDGNQAQKKHPTLFGGARKGSRHRYRSRRLLLRHNASRVTRILSPGFYATLLPIAGRVNLPACRLLPSTL